MSNLQIFAVAVIGVVSVSSLGLLLLIGVVHLLEKYGKKPPVITGTKR